MADQTRTRVLYYILYDIPAGTTPIGLSLVVETYPVLGNNTTYDRILYDIGSNQFKQTYVYNIVGGVTDSLTYTIYSDNSIILKLNLNMLNYTTGLLFTSTEILTLAGTLQQLVGIEP